MKRILLAFDGEHFSQSVFEFAQHLNAAQSIHAVGFFLPAVDYAELLYSFGGVPAGPLYLIEAISADEKTIKKNIGHFKELCKKANISFSVEADASRHIISMVKEETKFADLLIVDGQSMYKNIGEDVRDEYVSTMLHRSACPIVILPGHPDIPKGIILAYDGSEQAVFAIKQFYYLFPHLAALPTLLVYFGKVDDAIPCRKEAEQLFNGYFKNLTITKLNISDKNEIEHWIDSNRNSIVVTGSKGRSAFSELFKKSFVESLLEKHALPLFIAHH